MNKCSHYKGDDSCPMKQISPISCKGYKPACPEYTDLPICPDCGQTIDNGQADDGIDNGGSNG